MPDITMCPGKDCPLKERCYRFRATPTPWRQSYFVAPPFKETTDGPQCKYFWSFEADDE